jgi:hypothetical protein
MTSMPPQTLSLNDQGRAARVARWAHEARAARLGRWAHLEPSVQDVDNADVDVDLRPILGVIGRAFQRIHPLDLTADEALRLMTVLGEISDRLDHEDAVLDETGEQHPRPALRLVRDDGTVPCG